MFLRADAHVSGSAGDDVEGRREEDEAAGGEDEDDVEGEECKCLAPSIGTFVTINLFSNLAVVFLY